MDSQINLKVHVKFHRYKNQFLGTNIEQMTFHNSLTCGQVKELIKQHHQTYHKEFNEENGVEIASRLKLFVPEVLDQEKQQKLHMTLQRTMKKGANRQNKQLSAADTTYLEQQNYTDLKGKWLRDDQTLASYKM
jgi:hypothetical protein